MILLPVWLYILLLFVAGGNGALVAWFAIEKLHK